MTTPYLLEHEVEKWLELGNSPSTKVRVKFDNGEILSTTLGRALVKSRIGIEVSTVSKASISDVAYGVRDDVKKLKALWELGITASTKAGLTLSFEDFKNPASAEIKQQLQEISAAFYRGEFDQKTAWAKWDEIVKKAVEDWFAWVQLPEQRNHPLLEMWKSGARVSPVQIQKMVVGYGLSENITGKLNSLPIVNAFVDGLTPIEYFQSTAAAIKSLFSNNTAVPMSGYFTTQLVKAGRDLIVSIRDCGSTAPTRDVVHCEAKNGVCQTCVGNKPGYDSYFKIGQNVGVIAGETFGERGTQIALRAKHGSVVDFEHHTDQSALSDIINLIGGRRTAFSSKPTTPSFKERTTALFEEVADDDAMSWNDKCIFAAKSLVNEVRDIYSDFGINVDPLWYDVLARIMTDHVVDENGTPGRRSYGAVGDIKLLGIEASIKQHPSVWTRLAYGYVKQGLSKEFTNYSSEWKDGGPVLKHATGSKICRFC